MIVLVLGGARSGKSEVAERLYRDRMPYGPVTYVATSEVEDADIAARVAVHRARRPADWATVEPAWHEVVPALEATTGTGTAPPLLLDSLTAWVAAAPSFEVDIAGLCGALSRRTADTVVVSDEVGLGVHPSTEAGRQFRDRLGLLNQAVAEAADRVLLVVAGRVLPLERLQAGVL